MTTFRQAKKDIQGVVDDVYERAQSAATEFAKAGLAANTDAAYASGEIVDYYADQLHDRSPDYLRDSELGRNWVIQAMILKGVDADLTRLLSGTKKEQARAKMLAKAKPGQVVLVTQLPKCDLCRNIFSGEPSTEDAHYDAALRGHGWGNVCQRHYTQYKTGPLGTGRGQRLVVL